MQHPFLKLGALVALFYWLLDSCLHYFVYLEESFELFPNDIDELWMRILLCIILVVFGWYVDSARQSSEREILASESRFRSLVESSPDIVWRISPQGILTYVSPSVKQVLGYEPEELIGLSVTQQFGDRESRHKALEVLSQRLSGDLGTSPVVYQLQYPRRDGTRITVEIRSAPILGEKGEIVAVQGVARDITERSRLKQELEKMAKLESIGMLAAGIAHELNSFLTGILGHISEARLDDDPIERDKMLESAAQDTVKIKDLTFQLLKVARSGLPILRPIELGAFLRQSVDFTLNGSNLIRDYTIQEDLGPVEIDERQMRHVINSLLVNAQEEMPKGGSIKVSAKMTELNKEHAIPLIPGSYVKISIEDSGPGIPEDNRQQVFDPFFTTKPNGSGLGLPTAKSIVQQHNGYISMSSEVGKGTRFDIYLPSRENDIPE